LSGTNTIEARERRRVFCGSGQRLFAA